MAKELKSRSYIEDRKLNESIVLNEANGFDIPADLYASHVLEPAGITLDQEKKRVSLEKDLLAGAILCGGEQVAERFKTNPELHEVSMSIPFGQGRTASAVFGRGQETVMQIQTKYETAEFKRVLTYVNDLFAEVSN